MLQSSPIAIEAAQSVSAPARIGMLAGWGRYPLLVAEALRRQGSEVYCLGVVGHADPKLAEICRDFQFSGLGRFGAAIRYFKRHGVTDVIMAGKIHKVVLFKPWMIVRNMPDLRTIRMFIPHFVTGRRDNKDDTLLGAIVAEFAREGMRFGRPTDYAAGIAREPRATDPPRPDGLAMERHPLRLEAGQGDGPARRRAERGREGPGRAGDRGRRGHRRMHPPRRHALPRGRVHRGQSGQAAAGHALRRAHHRHADDREHRRQRRPRPGHRSRPHDPLGRRAK